MENSTAWAIAIIALLVIGGGIILIADTGMPGTPDSSGSGSTGSSETGGIGTVSASQPETIDIVGTYQAGLGNVLAGTNGHTLYEFQADNATGQSTCYNECAVTWPPLLIQEGFEPHGVGTSANLNLSTVMREDGTYQVTANGMPLYYYAGDTAAGQTGGQNLMSYGAYWYALNPAGEMVPGPGLDNSMTGMPVPVQY
jgi:predicted lipoprotein with Yx(FWY)xxD motif